MIPGVSELGQDGFNQIITKYFTLQTTDPHCGSNNEARHNTVNCYKLQPDQIISSRLHGKPISITIIQLQITPSTAVVVPGTTVQMSKKKMNILM